MSENDHKITHFYDLIILGDGVNDAGIARDAAGRGFKKRSCHWNDVQQ